MVTCPIRYSTHLLLRVQSICYFGNTPLDIKVQHHPDRSRESISSVPKNCPQRYGLYMIQDLIEVLTL